MHLRRPDPLLSLSSLSEQLRKRTDEFRFRIVKSNYSTQFAQTASELAEFRDATAGVVDAMDHDTLSDSFRKTVHLTTYDSYAALTAKFFEEPRKASAITNLFAPGIPDYIVKSSSTSGGISKSFPKYNRLPQIKPSDDRLWTISDSTRRRTTAHIFQFCYRPLRVEDENEHLVKTVYLTAMSAVNRRGALSLLPEQDEEKMAMFILDHAAPYAAGFIRKWRSFLLIQVLFALSSKSLETIVIQYASTFLDMMRHLDSEFDMMVDCIAKGIIPELEGVADVRRYLEMNMLPDPERAEELRSLGRPSSQPGWCSRAWPNLRAVTTSSSGSFVTYLPSARSFLGPNTEIHSRSYKSTETSIALPYNPQEPNQYKLDDESIMEFLDITKSDSVSALAQAWEVEVGRRYEIVLTTPDGLWRYRLGDVVEISGFDPTDGVPIIQFIERRNVAIRFHYFMVTEKELSAAISSMAPNITARIVGWTAMIDDRCSPSTVGFLVELTGDQVSDLALARDHVLDELSRLNERILTGIERDLFRKPTIRLLRPGTFSDFFQMKLDEGGSNNFGHVKVPVVLSKAAHITWFSNRVVQEL